jgi:hypothetical protein
VKLHLPNWENRAMTMCGRAIETPQRKLMVTDVVDDATCHVCHSADNRQSIETYRRECREAGIQP